ncbi:flavin reductase family protein [Halalkalibacterium halodurans]|uniref:flavin reductase family protein n=1 Tax=Halalkalibacterium halodurans TaxID=86665 RepID=UPI00106867EA|nr:flavin reductase family protein [Halalkalibacterium halodurans]MDY7222829.1 flavin reductase family protein [Halalkalibacterium halodurans]MDY7242050.1 flavin reductase family protein [Halalkalibacterium halodurans]MED4080939.1 flavin reductase family protein [Halalkalibacterium halodurans]MED4085122.1 flavin reductase family protein [Halalkalibacterium halodurans]MED4105300.1 flavin reductase family protein [Halalkalibacterium halodurans]
MMKLNPDSLSRKENYRLLIGAVLPRPIAFVTTKSKAGVVNAAPFSFYNVLTAEPPLIGISVGRKPDGTPKDTARNGQEIGEFVVHVVDEQNVEAVNVSSIPLPPEESEVEYAGLTEVPSEVVSVPSLAESRIRLECKVESVIPIGGKGGEPAADFLIGRVVHYEVADDLFQDGGIDTEALRPVSRLAGNEYGKYGETFSLDRPTISQNRE